MSNNKQSSSIDFFWNQLPEILPFSVDTETAVKLWEALEQAKAMHKEELQFAFKGGMNLVEGHLWKPIDKFEEFYNQTFGGEK